MKKKRFIYLIIWLLLPTWLSAQTNISAVEYWYDGDYGTAVQQSVTPGTNVSFTDLLDLSSLEPGLHTFTVRFKDTRGMWGSVLTQFFTYYPGSDAGVHLVTDAEYWYDGDYSSAIETPLTPNSSVDFNTLLDVSSLIDGLHTVTVRFKDDRGIWSSPMVRFFKKEGTSGLTQLIAAEYWFNDDYSSKHDSSFAATSSLNLTGMFDVSTLREGFNFVSLRVQNEAGKWGPVASWFFTKENPESLPELHKITAREYWFDGDYSSVHNDPVTDATILSIDEQIDVANLSDGLHAVSSRYRDEAGNWSPAYSTLFVKYPPDPVPTLREVVKVEYWIDGDYSQVNTEAVVPAELLVLDEELDVSILNNGLHTLTYRFGDEAGSWSSAITTFFSVYEDDVLTADNKIVRYRYWIDSNIEAATEIDLTVPVQTLELDEILDAINFAGGEHLISFQFQDSQGNWSSAFSDTYQKEINPTLSISASVSTICEGSTVSFTSDYSDADVIEWNFGDGTTSLDFMPEHTYTNAGTFEVTAIVTHTDSAKSAYDTIVGGITVNPSQNIWMGDVDTIFFSSFENDNLNAAPADWIQKYHGTGSANQIVVDDPVKNGTKSFQMEGSSGYASEFYQRPPTMPTEATLEAWVNCEKILSGLTGSIGVGNFNVGTWGTRTSRLQFYGGKISATYSGGPVYEIMDYTPGQWYHVKMIHNLVNRTYRVFINNTLVTGTSSTETTSDFPMHPTVETIDVMLCAGNSGTTKLFFDDILLTEKGNFEVCETDLPYQLGSQQISTEGFYSETFSNSYGCDSVVSFNLKINPVYEVELDSVAICQGDSYIFGTETLTTPGNYTDTLQTANGCDSILTLKLIVHPTYEIPLAASICEGNSYLFNGNELVSEGIYKDTLQTVNGCDSILTLTLTVDPAIETLLEADICEGDTYNFAGEELYADGIYRDTLQTVSNCDSIVVLTLNVHPVYEIPIDSSICEGESVSFAGETLTTSGSYRDTLQSALLCDSVIVLNLQVNPVYSDTTLVAICEDDSYSFGGTSYNTTGKYVHTLSSVSGCDSVVTLSLVVNSTSVIADAVTICENDLPYTFGESSLTSSGIYTEIFTNVNGCDSTVTLTLTVNDTSLTEVEMSVCENDLPLIIGLDTFYNEGIYTKNLNNIRGCDSTVILSLNVLDTSLVTEEFEICENLIPFTFGTQSLSTSGVYSETFTKENGCDSTVVLTLIVSDTSVVAKEVSVCESELPYIFGTQSLLADGSYTEQFTASTGCDSTVSLILSVLDSFLTEQEVTICESELPYNFGLQKLDSSGVFTNVYTAENGCDSTIILTLNVLDTVLQNKEVVICAGDVPYSFGTQTLTGTGTYTEAFTGSNGCDSTVILNLTVSDPFRISDTLTVCENELPFTFGTQTLLAEGIYTEQFTSSFGCDSTVVLVFAINDTTNSFYADTICENDLPYAFGTQSLTASGVFSETFIAANGCDSLVTLDLTVYESYTTHFYETISPSELPYIFGSQQLTKTGTFSNTYSTILGCDSTITMHLQVRDDIAPVAKCNPIEVELDQNGFYSLSNFDLVDIAQGSNDDISKFEDLEIIVSPSTFTCENIGENTVSVKVKDAVGNQAICETIVTVADLVSDPKIDDIPDQIINEDTTLQLVLSGISGGTACEVWDVDLSATNQNTELISALKISHSAFDSTAVLEILLQENQHGTDSIFVTVQDSLGNTSEISFLLTVNAVNDIPEIVQEIEDQIMTAGDSVTITVSKIPGEYFNDTDDTTLVFGLSPGEQGIPDWVVIQEKDEQYILTFIPTETDTGCFNLVLTIEDETGATTRDTFRVCIDPLEVGISQLEANNFEINLYPNPTRGEVNIDLFNPPTGEIELLVTNITGSQVLRKTYQSGERITFNLSENISGSYLVILQMHNKRIVRKLILDKK
ncbi:T9SS type A sorting domain-containing protein [Draconibacterium halophilum]|uniref:T9SS type A sorting domain-containing protein n=1 Tax=Draconibacterium halophilum TaxID=2706887 RepID=A0A6C0R7Q2_9BACT|nr:T9SS type A sorting domain-containing protein [Draconibacterium halophilum]QIA06324.1 T9SS type A sorting domain-containing protein [Draconibacterium halophilum]